MTDQQRAYHERQEALKAAQEVIEQSSDDVKAKVKERYEKWRVSFDRVMKSKPSEIQKHFPKLFEASEEIGKCAASFIGWSDTHESVAIYNHHEGVFHYEKVREKFQWAEDENKNKLRDEKGHWIRIGRRGGDKWIAGYGEKYGNAFPIDLFHHIDNFGTVVVAEGEKDAINLNLYGVPTLTMGGAGIAWRGDALELLRGRDVILWFDNDRAGRDGSMGRADENGKRSGGRFEEIAAVASSVTLVDWILLDPNAANKEDASDYLMKFGNSGADALIQKLKYCAYRPKVSRSWIDVSMAMAHSVTPLRSERDQELAFVLDRIVEAIKSDKESSAYPKLLERANDIIRKDEAKYNATEVLRIAPAKPEDPEQLKKWEAAQAKANAVFSDAVEDATLLTYFNRVMLGDLRKHVTSDVVLHWQETFEAIGVSFARYGSGYLYWCGTHYARVETYQFENTFNQFLELTRVNIKQRYNENSFKKPARDGIHSTAYHINDLRDRWKDFAVINHQNGTIIIDRSGNIQHKNHDVNDGMMYVLPFGYSSDAKMPLFQKFLDRVMPDQSVQMILAEYAGYMFLPGYVQKFLYLYGTGGNGKSVFIKIIESLLDEESVSHLEVINMFDKELDALNGKLLNVSTELESNAMVNKGQISVIKKIVAGEPIQINPKFDDSYVLRRPPKLIMSGNEKLKGGGLNDGLTRRMILVPFEQTIPANEMDEDLERKIIENEMPAILNWAIEGLLRLVKNKYKFTKSQTIEDSMEEYRVETDQIYSYIKECFGQYEGAVSTEAHTFRRVYDVNLIYNERTKIPTSYLYMHYVEWAKEMGINTMQQRNFITKLGEKLKTKSANHRVRVVHISKGYASGDSLTMTYPTEMKQMKCICGFSVVSDIKISVNGMSLTLMETIMQGE